MAMPWAFTFGAFRAKLVLSPQTQGMPLSQFVYAYYAPKALNVIAQGNALGGTEPNYAPTPQNVITQGITKGS